MFVQKTFLVRKNFRSKKYSPLPDLEVATTPHHLLSLLLHSISLLHITSYLYYSTPSLYYTSPLIFTTPLHFFINCPRFTEARRTLFDQVEQSFIPKFKNLPQKRQLE